MSKLITGILSIVLILTFLGITGCGGGGDAVKSTGTAGSTTTSAAVNSTTTAKTTATSAAAQSQSSASGLNWNDMPVYPGAKQIQQAKWSVPQSEDQDYSKMEWRYYEVSAAAKEVSAFYKEKMPALGWTETGWMDTQGNSWGWYNKNDEKDAAMVYVVTEEGKNMLAMWRASGKTSGSSQPTESEEEVNETTTPAATTATATKAGSGTINWDDMPVYSGAKQMQEANWSVPQSDDQDYSKMEWRYYSVSAAVEDVAAFYKEKMPSIGWTETGFMDTEGNSWGWYNKNDENDAAMVYIMTGDEGVTLALWRATR